MKSVSYAQLLDAAAYAMLGERCRQAYIHDIRGGLQALNSAIELLARSGKSSQQNGALFEKAAALAQRSLATHEQAVTDILERIAPIDEPATRVDLGALVQEVLHFLRNDASVKSIRISAALDPGVDIVTHAHKCRLLMLGLNVMVIDAAPAGSLIEVKVAVLGAEAIFELKSGVSYSAIRNPSDLWAGQTTVQSAELLLGLTSRWVGDNGGRIELDSTDFPSTLRISYPIAPPQATS